jgi:hypothetical protein
MKLLPGTGRGTSRRLVEGACRVPGPSTVLRTVPLPLRGRIMYGPTP